MDSEVSVQVSVGASVRAEGQEHFDGTKLRSKSAQTAELYSGTQGQIISSIIIMIVNVQGVGWW